MNCHDIRKRELIERYLVGALNESEQEAFERHYFECAECFEALKDYRDLQAELQRMGPSIRAEPLRGSGLRPWFLPASAAIAVLVLALGLWQWFPWEIRPSPSTMIPSLNALARLEPPPYTPATLRGSGDDARRQFREAMNHYVEGDYGAAIPGLLSASKLDANAPDISFFLGICHLLEDQTDAGAESLRKTVDLGDSPYLEEAHFYLAKAFLQQADLASAKAELLKTIELEGKLEGEARHLLQTLEGISPSETPGPSPTAAVQPILDEAKTHIEANQLVEGLEMADRALAASRQEKDGTGEAMAQQLRAKLLEELGQREEALVAWQEAAKAWKLTGDGPGQVQALVKAGLLIHASENFDKAEPTLAQALELGREETERPLAAARVLSQAGWDLMKAQKWGEVPVEVRRHFFEAALAIRERLAPDSLLVAATLSNMSFDHEIHGMQASIEIQKRVLAIRERLAPDSYDMVVSLTNLGNTLTKTGDFESAEHYLRRAIVLQERLDPLSHELGVTINNLGNIFFKRGNLREAEGIYREALEVLEKVASEDDSMDVLLTLAVTVNYLGIISAESGDLEAAQEYFERTLVVDEKVNPGSLLHASTLLNLGIIAKDQEDYWTARDYFRAALEIQEKLESEDAGTLIDLGNMLSELGDYRRAKEVYERAGNISEDSPRLLSALGALEMKQGNLALAEKYLRQALDAPGDMPHGSLSVAGIYRLLGKLALARGRLLEAQESLQYALDVYKEEAPNSAEMANVLTGLGTLSGKQGDLEKARAYHQQAVALNEEVYGKDHPRVVDSLNELAWVLAASGNTREALSEALRASRIATEQLRLTLRILPERQALLYEAASQSGRDLALTISSQGLADEPGTVRSVWEAVIRFRASVLDELGARHRFVSTTLDPKIQHLAEELETARERLARVVIRGPGESNPERYRELVAKAREKKEQAEEALAEESMAFRQERKFNRIGLEEVAAHLPPGSGLAAFVRYRNQQLTREDGTPGSQEEGVPSYLALVLRSGETDPALVPLGPAEGIESLVAKLRHQVSQEAMAPGRASKRNETNYRKVSAALREKIWDPLLPRLRGVDRVFVVPDGPLHLVNFSALPLDESSYLIEKGLPIHYLSTERDLVRIAPQSPGEGLLALGAPAFDETTHSAELGPGSERPGNPDVAHTAGLGAFRGNRSGCGDFQSLEFESLPAAAREVEEIAALWRKGVSSNSASQVRLRGTGDARIDSVLVLTGAAASEAALKTKAAGRRVLHLATHGFFLEGRCESLTDAARKHTWNETLLPATAENPLLLSGLALASANHRKVAGPEEEDGILTAEEIASLDLDGLEWVVLSACDTGVGKVKAGEGVFGLRRAFQIAGARTVIMSLWPVEDEAVREWMTSLYTGRFVDNLSTAESVHQASLKALKQRREENKSTHPFYWAGFIAAGDWR